MPLLVHKSIFLLALTCTILHYRMHNQQAHLELSAKPVERERFDVTRARPAPTAKASAQVHSITVKLEGHIRCS
jgi:hypothetical protein